MPSYGLDLKVDDEIITKIDLLDRLESMDRYLPAEAMHLGGINKRIEDAINTLENIIPQNSNAQKENYCYALIKLFANTVYIGESILYYLWRLLFNIIKERYELDDNTIFQKTLIFSEEPEIRNEFVTSNNLTGKLDVDKQIRSSRLGDFSSLLLNGILTSLEGNNDQNNLLNKFDEYSYFSRKYWILLIDNSISGISLYSELKKICGTIRALSETGKQKNIEKVIVLVQLFTEEAQQYIQSKINNKDSEDINFLIERNIFSLDNIHYGLLFDKTFKLFVPDERDGTFKVNDKCKLLDKDTLNLIKSLCEELDNKYLKQDPIYGEKTQWREKSKGNVKFGFHNGGYTIVTSKNCISNSIPLLWYYRDEYKAPYPRRESRTSQIRSWDEDLLKLLKEFARALNLRLGLENSEGEDS